MGIRSWGSGFRLWFPVSTHFLVNWVGSFKSSHMGIGAQELGSRLWASGEQTLLGIELCILFQVNSPRGSVHGVRILPLLGVRQAHTAQLTVYAISGQLVFMGFGISPLVTWGSNTARH